MFFQRGETGIVSQLEERIARLLRWPLDHGEGLQVLHYGPGAEYKPHHDYFAPGEPGTPTILKRGGQRVGTLDRKSTRLNSSHLVISYAVFCLKKKQYSLH